MTITVLYDDFKDRIEVAVDSDGDVIIEFTRIGTAERFPDCEPIPMALNNKQRKALRRALKRPTRKD